MKSEKYTLKVFVVRATFEFWETEGHLGAVVGEAPDS